MNGLALFLLIVGALVVLWIVLKIVFSIATALFVPLLLVGVGIMIGVWWAGRKTRR